MIATPEPSLTPSQKAGVLIEALPWLQQFAGALVVVKNGGKPPTASSDGAPVVRPASGSEPTPTPVVPVPSGNA